ncbi:MAG: hypothetical protein HY054_15530 [Proteobacteria bacterium]|nr:hypothetical protein [Pseudomonadota bacterium]
MRQLIGALLLALASACATAPVSGIDEVTLERTTCFGPCPAYSVTITASGAVTYVGRANTRVLGERHAQADHQAVTALHQRILDADFFNLRDEYRMTVADLAEYVVTVRRGNITKRVLDYGGLAAGMPPVVRTIEDEIDRVAATQDWIGTPDERGAQAPVQHPIRRSN